MRKNRLSIVGRDNAADVIGPLFDQRSVSMTGNKLLGLPMRRPDLRPADFELLVVHIADSFAAAIARFAVLTSHSPCIVRKKMKLHWILDEVRPVSEQLSTIRNIAV